MIWWSSPQFRTSGHHHKKTIPLSCASHYHQYLKLHGHQEAPIQAPKDQSKIWPLVRFLWSMKGLTSGQDWKIPCHRLDGVDPHFMEGIIELPQPYLNLNNWTQRESFLVKIPQPSFIKNAELTMHKLRKPSPLSSLGEHIFSHEVKWFFLTSRVKPQIKSRHKRSTSSYFEAGSLVICIT